MPRLTNDGGSREHSYIPARNWTPLQIASAEGYAALARIGICLDEGIVERMMDGIGMDADPAALQSTASISNPIQFLQNWLPGFVRFITQARKIDELLGINTTGQWEDEEVVQGILELTGKSVPYGDLTNVPLTGYNVNYERRTLVRFEQGMRVGTLEERRAARTNLNAASSKRDGISLQLEIQRNAVGFLGYNSGNNRTYGFLNDPNLPAYVGVSGGVWSGASFATMTAQLRSAFQTLRTQSGDVIDPKKTPITLAVPTNSVDYLTTTTDFGMSVLDWLQKNYTSTRIVSAPELNSANGGANVFYMYAESVADGSTDGGQTMIQVVPTKFMVLGVEKKAKGYEEDYSNATAGVFTKRPWAIVRRTGI